MFRKVPSHCELGTRETNLVQILFHQSSYTLHLPSFLMDGRSRVTQLQASCMQFFYVMSVIYFDEQFEFCTILRENLFWYVIFVAVFIWCIQVRFEVSAALILRIRVFRVVTLSNRDLDSWHFKGVYYLHHQGARNPRFP